MTTDIDIENSEGTQDPKHKLTPKKRAMIQAMEKSLGIVTTAANAAGISRWTHYEWVKSDPEYARQVKELEDLSLDFAETKLFENIRKGAEASTIFYLKTKGKRRGYIERTEVDATQLGIQVGVAEMPNAMDPDQWAKMAKEYQTALRQISNEE